MMYDADHGWPAPGWSLGFGKMYYLGSTGGCMLVAPDGTRRSYAGSHNIYTQNYVYYDVFTGYTTDGSLIDYSCTYNGNTGSVSGSASLPNGTTMSYTNGFPTRIEDAQGNYISIIYRNYGSGPDIDTISDTLG